MLSIFLGTSMQKRAMGLLLLLLFLAYLVIYLFELHLSLLVILLLPQCTCGNFSCIYHMWYFRFSPSLSFCTLLCCLSIYLACFRIGYSLVIDIVFHLHWIIGCLIFLTPQSGCDTKALPYLKEEMHRIFIREKNYRQELWKNGIVRSSRMSPRKCPMYVGTEEVLFYSCGSFQLQHVNCF